MCDRFCACESRVIFAFLSQFRKHDITTTWGAKTAVSRTILSMWHWVSHPFAPHMVEACSVGKKIWIFNFIYMPVNFFPFSSASFALARPQLPEETQRFESKEEVSRDFFLSVTFADYDKKCIQSNRRSLFIFHRWKKSFRSVLSHFIRSSQFNLNF